MTQHADTPESAFPERKFLILVATTTYEKIAQLNAIAKIRNHPVVFASLKDALDFHSADEDKGDRVEHAHDKSRATDHRVDLLIHSERHNRSLRKLCAQYAIPYDLQNISVITEDTSSSLDTATWLNARGEFAKHIPDDIFEKADNNLSHDPSTQMEFRGPGSEIGPLISAMGVKSYVETIRATAPANAPIYTQDHSTIVLRRLNESAEAPKKEITGDIVSEISHQEQASRVSSQRWMSMSLDHFSPMGETDRVLTDNFTDYLTNHSPRGQIEDALYAHLKNTPYTPAPASLVDAAKQTTQENSFNVRVMSPAPMPKITGFTNKMKGIVSPLPGDDAYLRPIDLSGNFGDHSDAYLFTPFNANDDKLMRRKAFQFFSTLVEKSLEATSMSKPIVVTNDGSWDKILALHAYAVNTGMTKDYDLWPQYEADGKLPLSGKAAMPGIAYKGTGLIDVVQNADSNAPVPLKNLFRAAGAVLVKRRKSYLKSVTAKLRLPVGPTPENTPYESDKFKVAFFTSAGSDNRELLNRNEEMAFAVSQLDNTGFVWGAGDRHGMGACYQGALRGGTYIEGYTTPAIAISETKSGKMPDCNYSELNENIFIRMAKMIRASDVIVLSPGGIGTIQELLAIMVLKDARPDLMVGKSVILHDFALAGQKSFWKPVIDTFLGTESYAKMAADPKALADKGVYLSTTVENNTALVRRLMDAKTNGPQPTLPQRLHTAPKFGAFAAA